jgi:undecaprenyl diphosphate synthase
MDPSKLPKHVAIIMDGNGRWAERRGLTRLEGHRQGAKSVREVVTAAREIGIRCLTLFAFSTENWGRPPGEVQALMALLEDYLRREREEILGNGIRLVAVGELWRLPPRVRTALDDLVHASRDNEGMTLCLALSFGGREEIAQAARAVAEDVRRGALAAEDVDEAAVRARLWTRDLPDPDLLIRTSGEMRISNFFLWQMAYTELYFTATLWPDFGRADLVAALEEYQQRERRFGLLPQQRPAAGGR